jgi:hypothetical protein
VLRRLASTRYSIVKEPAFALTRYGATSQRCAARFINSAPGAPEL